MPHDRPRKMKNFTADISDMGGYFPARKSLLPSFIRVIRSPFCALFVVIALSGFWGSFFTDYRHSTERFSA